MQQQLILGIDPGKQGGLTFLDGNEVVDSQPMPLIGKEIDVQELCSILAAWSGKIRHAYIEDVHAIFGTGAKSTFEFGRGLGIVEGVLASRMIPFTKVQPKAWQSVAFRGIPEMHKSTKTKAGKPKVDTKAMALLAVRRIFPAATLIATVESAKFHEGMVDATLIGWVGAKL